MKKIQIKIVLIGHLRHPVNLKRLRRFKSRLFSISEIERINTLPNPGKNDGYLDVEYSKEEITSIMEPINTSEIVIGIINYRFDDNFYLHRVGNDKACISIAGIDSILLGHGISIENFILKNILEMVVFKNALDDINGDEVYRLVHQDTRGCLFDLNGDKFDVQYNTEKPIICDSCKAYLNSKSLPPHFIKHVSRELKRIRKPFICSVEIFIKKYPLFSILITVISSVLINLLSNLIWEILKIKGKGVSVDI